MSQPAPDDAAPVRKRIRYPWYRDPAFVGALFFASGLVLNGVYTTVTEARDQHVWCTTIRDLNGADRQARKAPPSERPHGAYSKALITDFSNLQQELGCG